jgi:hypothetical protein
VNDIDSEIDFEYLLFDRCPKSFWPDLSMSVRSNGGSPLPYQDT